MGTATTGNAAEAAVLHAFAARGLDVLVPFGGNQPYDLVVHLPGNAFLRVQCKAAWARGGCLLFNSRTTDHGRGRMPYYGLADVFGVHFAPTGSVYLVPVEGLSTYVVTLRVDATRNNQRRNIRFASDCEIGRWTITELQRLAVPGHRAAAGADHRRSAAGINSG